MSIIILDNAKDTMGTDVDVGSFIDLEATTSRDNPEAANDPEKVQSAYAASRTITVTVEPALQVPLSECFTLTFELLIPNEGQFFTF